MTAPVPSPHLSPTAGLFNALLRLVIRGYDAYIAQLGTAIEAGRQTIRDSYAVDIAAADADTAEALAEQLATREEQWRREDEEAMS